LFCRGCGHTIRRDTPDTIYNALVARAQASGDPRLIVTFPVTVPKNFSEDEVQKLLAAQGYTRIHKHEKGLLEIVQDRVRIGGAERVRVIEALEAALRVGQGLVNIYPLAEGDTPRESAETHHSSPITGGVSALVGHLSFSVSWTPSARMMLRGGKWREPVGRPEFPPAASRAQGCGSPDLPQYFVPHARAVEFSDFDR
jgi:excinuclease UvrABC ATPase subunit